MWWVFFGVLFFFGALPYVFNPSNSKIGRRIVSNAIMANHDVVFKKLEFRESDQVFHGTADDGTVLIFTKWAKLKGMASKEVSNDHEEVMKV